MSANKKCVMSAFELPGRWYKANLHTHTSTSDGHLSVKDRVQQYRKAGYDVLAITDHGATNDVRGMSDKRMLVISGTEYHPQCPVRPHLHHLVGLNVPHPFTFTDLNDANRCIAEVKAIGGESFLAHPHWTGEGYEEFRYLEGLVGMEIYNSVCDNTDRALSEDEWDIAINMGMVLPVLGVDDSHYPHPGDAFKSWTWLKMPSLSVDNVLEALRTGACYASCGPKIHDFRVKDGKILFRCSPVSRMYLCGPIPIGARRLAEEGKSITAFNADLPNWPYIRGVAVDARGRKAWTNPIILAQP